MTKNERIIENFLMLAAIPHPSHHEKAVSDAILRWARERGLDAAQDAANNIIINKPGTPGRENAPVTILQAHMDMVCVAREGLAYNPLTDPIHVLDDGATLTAAGTSLGGDDGAGVAMAMTLLEDTEAVHGPIRAIFTVDEEDGMSGAEDLDAVHLQGKYLINLDWEDFGSLCCSSAGSDQYRVSRAATWEDVPAGWVLFDVTVGGLTGGHSGAEIHCGRANAIKELAGMLQATVNSGLRPRLCAFDGGSAHNAIPSSARALVAASPEDAPFFYSIASAEALCRKAACLETDPDAELNVTPTDEPAARCLAAAESIAYIDLLANLFNGVRTMSPSIEWLVESSSNVGIAHATESELYFVLHARSSEPALMAEMQNEFRENASLHGFGFEVLAASPAWPVKPGSHLVELCAEEFRRLTGKEISVEPVHAGLECGCFSQKNPALDIISIGPEIRDIHSPREALVLDTVYTTDDMVRNLLKVISEE